MKKWIRRIALGLVALVLIAAVLGSGYEMLGRRRASHEFPPPGRMVDIGGRRMQLDCRGQGSPVVVFEAGLDMNGSLAWSAVHDSIAKTTRACAYSRAGIMWSDEHEGLQDATTVARDLHATLDKAGERPPFVLVGHSLGGPYIMTYTKDFGADVAGLVFVDASHPDQVERFKKVMPASGQPSLLAYKLAAAFAWTGVVRAIARGAEAPHVPPRAALAMSSYASTSLGPMLKEQESIDRTFAEAGSFRQLGNRPLYVLTAMAPLPQAALTALKMTKEQGAKFQDVWKTMHDEEASWSSRSQHQLVPDATHYIQFDRPDIVIAAVRSVVDSVRAVGGIGR